MSIIRATTPPIKYKNLPFDATTCDEIVLMIKQGNVLIERDMTELDVERNSVSCYLTHAETKSLSPGPVEVQLWWAIDGKESATRPKIIPVEKILDDTVGE